MLLLKPHAHLLSPAGGRVWADLTDDPIAWTEPTTLRLARTPPGPPHFALTLVSSEQGGLQAGYLRLGLEFAPPPPELYEAAHRAGVSLQPIQADAARLRLILRATSSSSTASSSTAATTGTFRELSTHQGQLVAQDVLLSPAEAEIARQLFVARAEVAEVELHWQFTALEPGIPWHVRCQRPDALQEWFHSQLPNSNGLAHAQQIEALWQTLPTSSAGGSQKVAWLEFEPLPSAPPLPLETLLRAAGRQLSAVFFAPQAQQSPWQDPHFTVRPANQIASIIPAADLSRPTPVVQQRIFRVGSAILNHLLTPEELREAVSTLITRPLPLQPVQIQILAAVPFHPRGLLRVHVDMRPLKAGPGASAASFILDAATSRARWLTTSPDSGDFEFEMKLTATAANPSGQGWPRVVRTDWTRASGPVVHLTPEKLGLRFLQILAPLPLLQTFGAVQVALYRGPELDPPTEPLATAVLDQAQPESWLALELSPTEPLHFKATRHSLAPQNEQFLVASGQVMGEMLRLPQHISLFAQPIQFTFVLGTYTNVLFATLSTRTSEDASSEEHFVLRPGEPIQLQVAPPLESVATNPRQTTLEYRVGWILADPVSSHPLPLEFTPWQPAIAGTITIRHPEIQSPT